MKDEIFFTVLREVLLLTSQSHWSLPLLGNNKPKNSTLFTRPFLAMRRAQGEHETNSGHLPYCFLLMNTWYCLDKYYKCQDCSNHPVPPSPHLRSYLGRLDFIHVIAFPAAFSHCKTLTQRIVNEVMWSTSHHQPWNCQQSFGFIHCTVKFSSPEYFSAFAFRTPKRGLCILRFVTMLVGWKNRNFLLH